MTNRPRIGIVISTTRAARFADKPTLWLQSITESRSDLDIEIVDLRDYPLPFFDESLVNDDGPAGAKWASKMAELDGYIFVTAI